MFNLLFLFIICWIVLCFLLCVIPDCRLSTMAVQIPFLKRHLARGCYRVCCGVAKPLVHVRSVHVAESGTRSDEELAWEAASSLPFSRAKMGTFFQERPVLKNPFLEDALLRGYLRRHLPKEVKRKTLHVYKASVVDLLHWCTPRSSKKMFPPLIKLSWT